MRSNEKFQIIEMASRKRHNNLKPIACHSFGASMICKLLDRGQILLSQMSIQVPKFCAFPNFNPFLGISSRLATSVARFGENFDARNRRRRRQRSFAAAARSLSRAGESARTICVAETFDRVSLSTIFGNLSSKTGYETGFCTQKLDRLQVRFFLRAEFQTGE